MGSCVSKHPDANNGRDPAAVVVQEEETEEEPGAQQDHGVKETDTSSREEVPEWTLGEALGGLSSSCRGGWQGDAVLVERFGKVTELAHSVLNCELADICLVEDERNWLEGPAGGQDMPEIAKGGRKGLDPCQLVPVEDEYIVVNDLGEYKGYSNHPCVVGEPRVRFFAGIWLVSAQNPTRRHGVLFVADTRPRSGKNTTDIISFMKEFRDLVVGEIEKYELELLQTMVQERRQRRRSLDGQNSGKKSGPVMSRHVSSTSSRGSEESVGSLCAAVDCFHEGVMLLESSTGENSMEAHWKVLYMNEYLSHALKVGEPSEILNKDIWESFSVNCDDRSAAYRCMRNHVSFEMSLTLQNRYHPHAETFIFEFRPASVTQYSMTRTSDQQQFSSLRKPNRPENVIVDKYYFAIVKTPGAGQIALPGSQRHLPLMLSRDAPTVFKDIRLGPMIGRGAYGRVYRGNWNGNIVAVKVITSDSGRRSLDGAQMHQRPGAYTEDISMKSIGMHEAAISTALSHPNVVHTYQYSVRHVEVSREKRDDSLDQTLPSTPMTEIWLISEFCNRGPLLTAIENGMFLIKPNDQRGQPNLIFILQTLQEISSAMEYLHSHDIVHGDLTGGNVLLTSSDKDGRGFTAKVVDFGLSRICEGGALKTSKMGCAEYMPPELITGGLLTKSGDVYAFGVILWELYHGERAWSGMKPVEVLEKVARHDILTFGEHTPRRLKILGEKCLNPFPKQRPDFSDIVFEVNSILSDTMCILQKFLGATTINAQHT